MATLRAIPRSSFALILSAFMLSTSILVGSYLVASGTNHDQTFYACLYAGSLSQVNTTAPPANCGRGTQVEWNAAGLAGAPGAPGSPGISGLTTVSTSGSITAVAAGSEFETILPCPDGRVPIGSGYQLSGADPESFIVTTDRAIAADPNNPFGFADAGINVDQLEPEPYGWYFGLTPIAAGAVSYALDVYCAYVTPPVLP